LAETQASAAEHERRLAEEQERHAEERDELTAQSDRLQEELGGALERLAVVGPAAEERDELRAQVQRLREDLADVKARSESELRDLAEERATLTAELADARELLQQAERVRDSQIALEAERDRAVAELEQLRTVASEAQAEVEERSKLLAEEQDRHHAERETLLAQRTVLEEELGSSIEQLAAAAAASDARETQLQVDSERLLEALDAIRELAAELISGADDPSEEGPPGAEEFPEAELESPEPKPEAAAEPEEIDYSLFVPGPNGYELVPQTGVPPQAGQRVELDLPDRDEPVLFEVVRSGRTLPGGDVCVYLAQV
jgi:chromosome segregation ATPase